MLMIRIDMWSLGEVLGHSCIFGFGFEEHPGYLSEMALENTYGITR